MLLSATLAEHVEKQRLCQAQALIVDCANGVGAQKLQRLTERLNSNGGGLLRVDARNTDIADAARLNEGCGADFVQKERQLPGGFQGTTGGARHAVAAGICSLPETCPLAGWKHCANSRGEKVKV